MNSVAPAPAPAPEAPAPAAKGETTKNGKRKRRKKNAVTSETRCVSSLLECRSEILCCPPNLCRRRAPWHPRCTRTAITPSPNGSRQKNRLAAKRSRERKKRRVSRRRVYTHSCRVCRGFQLPCRTVPLAQIRAPPLLYLRTLGWSPCVASHDMRGSWRCGGVAGRRVGWLCAVGWWQMEELRVQAQELMKRVCYSRSLLNTLEGNIQHLNLASEMYKQAWAHDTHISRRSPTCGLPAAPRRSAFHPAAPWCLPDRWTSNARLIKCVTDQWIR